MKLKEQLQGLLQTVQGTESTKFLQTVKLHVANKQDLEELLQTAPRKDLFNLYDGLKKQTEKGVKLISSSTENDNADTGAGLQDSKDLGADLLIHIAVLAKQLLNQKPEAPPEPLKDIAGLLHDNALLAASDFPSLQDEVAKLCLEWWQAEAPGKEQLTPQTVPYLLVKALTTGTAADVKRCHSMRNALQLFDFDDPSIAHLKMLLLRAAFAPSFLRCVEGRRMIAYMFSLQPAFVAELAAIVKNQIPAGRKSVLDAYGEILYRAWSTCTGACLLNVQQNCIQSLMEAAILASTPAMATSLRRVLNGLHSQKHMPGVDKMLLELYQPILFRRLNAANANVRRNALYVFIDAFPLRDPDESNLETDNRLNEQFAQLTTLLKDSVPEVRAAAVHGVCRVLNEFWELLPGTVTASYMKLMAGELAFDAASPAVRAAVAEGFSTLVDNALAQPLLKIVLPQLEALLFDSAIKVRTAMADLLLALRGCESLPFYNIVPVEKLLDVLASDVASVSERIQRLLLPTFFPNQQTGPALVAALLRKSPAAGKAFCQYLTGTYQPNDGKVTMTAAGPGIHENEIVGLISDLRAHLLGTKMSDASIKCTAASKSDGKGSRKSRSKRKKAQPSCNGLEIHQDEESEHEVLESPDSWEAILHGLEALVCGLAAVISANKCDKSAGDSLFLSGSLVDLMERCPTATAQRAVMAMAAAFPLLDASAEVRGRCLNKLLGGQLCVALNNSQFAELQGAIECIYAGASRDRLLNVIVASLGGDPSEVLQGLRQLSEHSESPSIMAGDKPIQGYHPPTGKKATSKASKTIKDIDGKICKENADSRGKIDNSLACQSCSSRARGNEMLLCDNCDAAYHLSCLEPPLTDIPAGDWFCIDCNAIMTNKMPSGLAIRCLDILMRDEEQRKQLVASGAIARLLPCLDAILQEQVKLLLEALAHSVTIETSGVSGATSFTMMVYLKGSMHLLLADQGLSTRPGLTQHLARTNNSNASQAAECIRQAVDWVHALLQHLVDMDVADILQSLIDAEPPELKRSKTGRKKANSLSEGRQYPVKETFAVIQACMLVFAESAKGGVLCGDAVPDNRLACSVCTLALQFLTLAGSIAEEACSHASSSSQAGASEIVGATIANITRLARYVAVSIKPSRSTNRDLDSVLQRAQQSEQSEVPLVVGVCKEKSQSAAAQNIEAVEELAGHILAMCCKETTIDVASKALKPLLPELLGGLCQAAEFGELGAHSCCESWINPIANLLSQGFELEEVPKVAAGSLAACTMESGDETNENVSVVANHDSIDRPAGKADQSSFAAEPIDLSAFASQNASHPLVKMVLTAAKSSKVQEQLAAVSASVALGAFKEGYSQRSLGALELSTLLGFKGVTTRGKSRTGADSFVLTIERLRTLKRELEDARSEELQQAGALLYHKLQDLFPPPVRVTFDAAYGA